MKKLLLILFCLVSLNAFALNRYQVTNDFTGNMFMFESDKFDHWEPAYGLKSREIPCVEVPENELTRIIKRETREVSPAVYEEPKVEPTPEPTPVEELPVEAEPVEPDPRATPVPKAEPVVVKPAVIIEFCTLKDQFTVVSTDLTAELAAKKAKEDKLKADLTDISKIKGKGSLSNAERDKILLYLLEQLPSP
jgi:hypothetical protein